MGRRIIAVGASAGGVTALGDLLSLLPWDLEARVVTSLLVGPTVGVVVHLAWGRQRIG